QRRQGIRPHLRAGPGAGHARRPRGARGSSGRGLRAPRRSLGARRLRVRVGVSRAPAPSRPSASHAHAALPGTHRVLGARSGRLLRRGRRERARRSLEAIRGEEARVPARLAGREVPVMMDETTVSIWDPLRRFVERLGTILPVLFAVLVVLAAGLAIAWLLEALVSF